MGVTDDLADELALKVIKYVDASGDDSVITEIVNILGATSQSAEEAFLTSMRVRRANMAARAHLLKKAKAFQATLTAEAEGAEKTEPPA